MKCLFQIVLLISIKISIIYAQGNNLGIFVNNDASAYYFNVGKSLNYQNNYDDESSFGDRINTFSFGYVFKGNLESHINYYKLDIEPIYDKSTGIGLNLFYYIKNQYFPSNQFIFIGLDLIKYYNASFDNSQIKMKKNIYDIGIGFYFKIIQTNMFNLKITLGFKKSKTEFLSKYQNFEEYEDNYYTNSILGINFLIINKIFFQTGITMMKPITEFGGSIGILISNIPLVLCFINSEIQVLFIG